MAQAFDRCPALFMLLSMSPDSHDLDPQQPGELTRTLFLPKAPALVAGIAQAEALE